MTELNKKKEFHMNKVVNDGIIKEAVVIANLDGSNPLVFKASDDEDFYALIQLLKQLNKMRKKFGYDKNLKLDALSWSKNLLPQEGSENEIK